VVLFSGTFKSTLRAVFQAEASNLGFRYWLSLARLRIEKPLLMHSF